MRFYEKNPCWGTKSEGIEADHTINRILPEVRIIGLSIDIDKSVADALLAVGSADILSDDSSPRDVLKAIRKHAVKSS